MQKKQKKTQQATKTWPTMQRAQQQQQQQRSGQKRTTRNAMPTVRRGEASRGVCYDLIKCQRQISVKVGQTQCSQVAAPERTKTKENCKLQTANCQLPTGDCRLQTASCQLATANCQQQSRTVINFSSGSQSQVLSSDLI